MTEKRAKALALAAELHETTGLPKFTFAEIAEQVGASASSVQAWVMKAREEHEK